MGSRLVAVALVCMTVACAQPAGQTQPTTPQPPASQPTAAQTAASPTAAPAITFTLTTVGCTTEGLRGSFRSDFAALVVNLTSSRAVFNLHRLNDGREYLELQEHIQARQQGIAAGRDTPVLPPMTTHIASATVEAGQRGRLDATVSSGTYGLVCRRDSPTGASEAIYVQGPFRIG